MLQDQTKNALLDCAFLVWLKAIRTWRKGWDSNPRYLAALRFSRAVHSTRLCDPSWRRRRDSNSREGLLPPNDLANHPLQPLGYSSAFNSQNFGRSYILTSTLKLPKWYNTLMDKEQSDSAKPAPDGAWQFKPDDDVITGQTASTPRGPQVGSVTWEASEFVANRKTAGWYMLLGGAAALISALVYLLTHDRISSGMIIIVALALGIFAARKPRVLQYKLDESGLSIGTKFYPYPNFKSFAMVDEDALSAIWLIPLQRFMPIITMYYDPKDEQEIADLLSQFLPFEPKSHDLVERFMRKIRF